MGTVTAGRKHLRERNLEGLERWLIKRQPEPKVRAQLLRDTLGMRDSPSVRGTWLEATGVLIKSLSRTSLGLDTLKGYWKILRQPEAWKVENHPPTKEHLLKVLDLLPRKHHAEAMDHMLTMAMLSGQKGLFSGFSSKLKADWELPLSQHTALSQRDYDQLDIWFSEGRPLQPTVAARIAAGSVHQPFLAKLFERPAWPGTDQGLFETAVLCGMIHLEEGTQKKLVFQLLEWGVTKQGWLEVNPSTERYVDSVAPSQLARRLLCDQLAFVRGVPNLRMSMEDGGRLFVQAAWEDAWPTRISKTVALQRVSLKSPEHAQRVKPRL